VFFFSSRRRHTRFSRDWSSGVLFRSGKGGGLAAMGGAGTETFIGGRQAATILVKTTWVTGAAFMILAFILSVMSSRQARPDSLLRQEFQQAVPVAPQPILPGVQQEGAEPAAGETPPAPPTESSPEQ